MRRWLRYERSGGGNKKASIQPIHSPAIHYDATFFLMMRTYKFEGWLCPPTDQAILFYFLFLRPQILQWFTATVIQLQESLMIDKTGTTDAGNRIQAVACIVNLHGPMSEGSLPRILHRSTPSRNCPLFKQSTKKEIIQMREAVKSLFKQSKISWDKYESRKDVRTF